MVASIIRSHVARLHNLESGLEVGADPKAIKRSSSYSPAAVQWCKLQTTSAHCGSDGGQKKKKFENEKKRRVLVSRKTTRKVSGKS